MTQLTPQQVYAYARQAGFGVTAAITMTAIAGAESTWRTDAIGDRDLTEPGERSVGLWQINYRPSRDRGSVTRDPQANLDPATNARNAFTIAGGGKSFRPWSTYTSGAYTKYLSTARAAVGSSAPPATTGPVPNRGTTSGTVDANNAGAPGPLGWIWNGEKWVWGKLGDAAGGAVSAVTDKVREIVLVGLFVLGGVGLVAAGVWRGTENTRKSAAGDAAAVIAAPETGGASLAATGGLS